MTSFSRFAAPGLIDLPQFADERGVLTSIESGLVIPFEVKRVFFISDASGNRGNHAHRFTTQLLVAVAGSFTVDVSAGRAMTSYELQSRSRALFLPPLTWVRLYGFSPDAVCLALADTSFAESAYIHDWDEFVRETSLNNE
jgi:hypothetical protein